MIVNQTRWFGITSDKFTVVRSPLWLDYNSDLENDTDIKWYDKKMRLNIICLYQEQKRRPKKYGYYKKKIRTLYLLN